MLDNQLEKEFELKGGMIGGVLIQQLLGKVALLLAARRQELLSSQNTVAITAPTTLHNP